jgi:transposase-like protein
VYRADDQYGQIIDVSVSPRRCTRAGRRFFNTALHARGEPAEVVTDRAAALRGAIDELIASAFRNTEHYANNRIEVDDGRTQGATPADVRTPTRDHAAPVIVRGLAFTRHIRRGHVELGVDAPAHQRVAAALTELALTM